MICRLTKDWKGFERVFSSKGGYNTIRNDLPENEAKKKNITRVYNAPLLDDKMDADTDWR